MSAKDQVDLVFNKYSIRWSVFFVIWKVKDLFLCHLSVCVENGTLAISGFDRAGLMDERLLE